MPPIAVPVLVRSSPWLAVAPALGLLVLTGCGGGPDVRFAPTCPQLKLLANGADLTRVRGQGTDLTDMVLQARITGVPASCNDGGRNTVRATINVLIDGTRGPAAATRAFQLPYLVTVTLGEQPIDQKLFVAQLNFPANVDRTSVAGEDVILSFPVTPERAASAYTIYVSFRLTGDELAANRRVKR